MKRLSYYILSIIGFFFLFSNCSALQGGNVSIKGHAFGAENKQIIIKRYSDNLTQREQLLSKSLIGQDGFFELKCNIHSTELLIIQIEYYSGEMYADPNSNYEVEIKNLVFNEKLDMTNHYLSPKYFFVNVVSGDKNHTNNLIFSLNYKYNSLIRKNALIINKPEMIARADSFMVYISDTFGNLNNDYFQQYLHYRLASLKLLISYSDKTKMLSDYISGKPILYDNIEYMSFFSDYFENYLSDITHPFSLNDLLVPVNQSRNLNEALEVIGRDSLLKNELIRELVFLKAMELAYASKYFKKRAVIELLYQFSNKSKFEKNKIIALNIIQQFNRFEKGSEAENFSLKNTDEKIVSLEDFRGKLVYVGFYTTWCKSCLDELELMKKLVEKFKDKVAFISISADRELMKSYYLRRDKNYEWSFLHFGNDYNLLESYAVYAYPTYVLLDSEGKILQCPAPKPSENIEMLLNQLTK